MPKLRIFLLLLALEDSRQSGAVSDLALMTRTEGEHPAISLKSPVADGAVLPPIPEPRSMLIKREEFVASEDDSHSSTPAPNILNLWRVRILLALLILAIVGSVGVAAVYTARVFGILPESSEVVESVSKSTSVEEDPESLTRLLHSQTFRGYGSLFVSDEKQAIIMQN